MQKNLIKPNFFAMAQHLGISLEQARFQAQSLYPKVYVLFRNVLVAPCLCLAPKKGDKQLAPFAPRVV